MGLGDALVPAHPGFALRQRRRLWPEYYADGLPAVANIGLGSPTGVKFGTRSRFPDKYQKAMFLMDWSYGRIVALHLRPKGASYEGDYETFVQGKPLNVSDMEFGADGALYFVTGGRGTQSGLYRVGARPEVSSVSLQSSSTPAESRAAEARSLRRSLEAYHGKIDSAAIDFAWPHLNSDDRWIRYAARTAVEQQELALWKGRALAEQRPSAALAGLMALARVGAREHETQIVESIGRLWKQSLTEAQKLDALRVLAVAFTRARLAELGPNAPGDAVARLVSLAPPAGAIRQAAGQYLSSAYPSSSPVLNRELVQLLVYLEAPEVIDKTLDLAERAATQEDQIHYLFHLRNLRSGWAPAQRRKYFGLLEKSRTFAAHPPELTRWFAEANRPYSDGASFAKNLANLRKDALAAIPETERSEFANLTAPAVASTAPAAPARNFVRDWKMEEFAAELSAAWRGRSFAKGKQAFADAQCLACHRFGNEGGALGPDLTAIASRFTRRDVLESILEPSKVLSEQFLNTRFFLKNGEDVTGRVLDENDRRVEVLTEPLSQTKTEVRKADIVRREPSKVSPMPAALVNTLTKAEVLDLLAYIESAGNATAAAYK
jgi:putative heme-binding domain-containing protein